MAATLASFAETQQMLAEQGNKLDIKTVRLLAYRAAKRARMAQKMGEYGWQEQDNLAGRRVVVSTDGGRVRLRRMLLGMSQEKLGESLGLTFQQVQKYEKGVNRVSAGRLFEIADVLEVPVAFFFEGADFISCF